MGFGDDCVRFYGIEKEMFQLAHIMLFLRERTAPPRNNKHRGHFSSSERNRPTSLRSSLLSYLIKLINYDHQAIAFLLQLSVFTFFNYPLQATFTGSSAITIAKSPQKSA